MTWQQCKWYIIAMVLALSTLLILVSVPEELRNPLGFAILAGLIHLNGWRDWRKHG